MTRTCRLPGAGASAPASLQRASTYGHVCCSQGTPPEAAVSDDAATWGGASGTAFYCGGGTVVLVVGGESTLGFGGRGGRALHGRRSFGERRRAFRRRDPAGGRRDLLRLRGIERYAGGQICTKQSPQNACYDLERSAISGFLYQHRTASCQPS